MNKILSEIDIFERDDNNDNELNLNIINNIDNSNVDNFNDINLNVKNLNDINRVIKIRDNDIRIRDINQTKKKRFVNDV